VAIRRSGWLFVGVLLLGCGSAGSSAVDVVSDAASSSDAGVDASWSDADVDASAPDVGALDAGEGPAMPLADAGLDSRNDPFAGCGQSAGYPGVDGGGCTLGALDQQKMVDYEDRTLGYSAHDVMDAINDPGVGTLSWWDGTRTKIRFHTTYGAQAVRIDNYPPYQGYCYRDMRIDELPSSLGTDDGRLAEQRGVSIVAIDLGGPNFAAAWPSWDGAFDVTKLKGSFSVPPEWQRPGNDVQYLTVVYNTRRNTCSPSCGPGESFDSIDHACTNHAGKLMFQSQPKRCIEQFEQPCPELFYATAATWEWD
jgi:hypothetical protein